MNNFCNKRCWILGLAIVALQFSPQLAQADVLDVSTSAYTSVNSSVQTATPDSNNVVALPRGRAFVRDLTGQSAHLPSSPRDLSDADLQEITQDFLRQHRQQLDLRRLNFAPLQARRSHYGAWQPMSVHVAGQMVLRRQLLLHINKNGQPDRLSGFLPQAEQLQGQRRLDAVDALLAASTFGPPMGFVDPSCERNPGSVAHALWDAGQSLIPVYVVYPRSRNPVERFEIILDARDGSLVARRNRTVFAGGNGQACANVFTPSPGTSLNAADVHESLLPYATADDQGYLNGRFFRPYNCCKNVDCASEGEESRLQGSMPNPIGIGADPLYYDIVNCSEHSKLHVDDVDKADFRRQPIDPAADDPDYNLALEDDFAEAAVYFAVQNHFDYMRRIGDPNFLLRAQGGADGEPEQPFHVTVNFVLPDLQQAYEQAAPWPMGQGRGDVNNPVVIDDYMRVDNAMYMPAQTPDPSMPIDILSKDYDSVVFFQGQQRDFAYDGDIVYHEFTHSIVGSTSQLLNSLVDSQGSSMAPGALNEGYADYFAASLSNDSLTGEYAASTASNEGGIRDADNTRTCPRDLTGEVHDDSWPWSGSLWTLRDVFVGADCDRERFDAAIYDAMIGLPQQADFAVASEATAIALAGAYGRDSGASQIARCVFQRRGMWSCERVLQLLAVDDNGQSVSTPVSILYFPAAAELGLDEGPGQMQLRVDAPAGSSSITLAWNEGSGGLDSMLGGGTNFDFLVKRGEPIEFSRSASGSLIHDADARLTVQRQNAGFGQPAVPDPLVYEADEACGGSYFFAVINSGASASASAIQASVQFDQELADSCAGDSEIIVDAAPVDPAACTAMPSQDRDSESCAFDPPHLPEACGLAGEDAGVKPEPNENVDAGCSCNSKYGFHSLFSGVIFLFGLAWRRRYNLSD